MAAIGLGGGGGAAGGGGAGGGNGGGNNPYGYMSGLECLQKQLQEKKDETDALNKQLEEVVARNRAEQQVKRKQTRHNQRGK